MRFMLMIKGTKQSEAGVLPSKRLMERMIQYNAEPVDAGALIAVEGLHPSSTGARVKFTGGVPAVTAGAFAETKELIAGFTLIQAGSLRGAIECAGSWPAIDGEGEVELEVRGLFGADEFAAEYMAELAKADAYQHQRIAARQWPPEY
jgi:hypothetical protein